MAIDEEVQVEQAAPLAWEDRTNGKLLVQIEYYRETKVRAKKTQRAWERFQNRLNVLEEEVDFWKTIVFDSVTFAELAARKLNQYKLNPRSREPRQWFAGSTDALEETLMMTLSALPVNVVAIAHVSDKSIEVHGVEALAPNAPGRLRKNLSSAFAEFYHMEVIADEKGNRTYQLQTRRDAQFNAATQIGAPDPCVPDYKELWSAWEGEKYPLHCFCYSDSGGGKSTFAATFPKPMLVLMWDPIGKDAPYRKRGRTVDVGVDEFGTPVSRVYKIGAASGRKIQRKGEAA
jgi:hypothetical protein